MAWLQRPSGRAPLVVAHRGASGLAPENTLAAFRRALDLGTPAVECDVHLSADGFPVVIHDAMVDRTTNGTGAVEQMKLADLRRLDAGTWFGAAFAGQTIPTLPEVLAVCAHKARLFVELKVGGGRPLVDAALLAIERAPGTDVAIISFDPEIVRLVAARRPDLPVGYLASAAHVAMHGAAKVIAAARGSGAAFLSPNWAAARRSLVRAAHAAGLGVSAWTVDKPRRMQTLANTGVDAITTNRPDLALDLFGRG
jgi:glycerophosphoryl diester phosphodiesterase